MSDYANSSRAGESPRERMQSALCSVGRRMRQAAIASLAVLGFSVDAVAEDRALKLFFTHTGEKATITFKRDGKFDPRGLAQINRFLRDWRKNEPARMDPRLLDLVWEVYDRSGGRDYIHVVSAYRSPGTNNMLRSRSRSSGVAKNSQHTLGKAMDFYIPGVKLATLRALAMQLQVGGVGYYPRSGSPFVHLDVGRVRAWPRMSRQELASIFPKGQTMHVPADGRPLPGYSQAIADYKKRVGPRSIEIAASVDEDDEVGVGTRSSTGNSLQTALAPIPSSRAETALTRQIQQASTQGGQSFADLSTYAIPVPTLRASDSVTDQVQTASIGKPAALPLKELSRAEPMHFMRLSTQPLASLPMSASVDLHAGVKGMSPGRLMAWALHAPGELLGLSAPRIGRRTILNNAGSVQRSAPVATAREFDRDRFGPVKPG